MATPKKSIDFEDSLKQLETLVTTMETGELSLEASLKAFEEGVQIIRHCQHTLQAAEQRVNMLRTDNDSTDSEPL